MSSGAKPSKHQRAWRWGCGTTLAVIVLGGAAIGVVAGSSSGGGNFTKGHIGGSCPSSPIHVGDQYIVHPQVFNDSGTDWPHTYINFSADGFVIKDVGDDTGGSATSINQGDYELRGIRPHDSMTAALILVAKRAGNFKIDGMAWGGSTNDGSIPNNPLAFGCDVVVNPA